MLYFNESLVKSSLFFALICISIYGDYGLTYPSTSTKIVSSENLYNNEFDNVNLDEILNQDRLLNNYIKCLESAGPCTPDGKMLKQILPDAMLTDCSKCTQKQKNGAEKVTSHLIDNRPKDWERLEKIYDPMGTYRLKYQKKKQNQI
ncbi:hypothetical protein KR067_005034 [Drosophila pandora]|nr:hypothetical protein KR067_005034 [Drosophila pandora]